MEVLRKTEATPTAQSQTLSRPSNNDTTKHTLASTTVMVIVMVIIMVILFGLLMTLFVKVLYVGLPTGNIERSLMLISCRISPAL